MSERVGGKAGARLFSLEEGLSPLNDYFTFSPEDRIGVITALSLASAHLPTARECYVARREGSTGEMRIENMYGDFADTYAHSIDKSFTTDRINDGSKTSENRRRFYNMVNTLTAEQVEEGVRRILSI